jgi:hypothetical protein
LLENLSYSSSPKYKRAVQMTFAMAALARSKSGVYTARKAIPRDAQDEYARLYGTRWEEKLTLPASLRPQEAKARYGEWLFEVEGRITAIRAGSRGDRRSLSQKQAMALAGEWYRSFIAQYDENPGSPERWDENFSLLIDLLMKYAPDDIQPQNPYDLDQLVRNPEVRNGIRPGMAEEARVDQFLADRGISLTSEAYDLFIDCVLPEYVHAVQLLERRARGDFAKDRRPEQFPKFEPAPKPHQDPTGLTPWKLFDMWVKTKKPAPATVDRWRGVFVALQKHFEGRTAGSITTEEAQAWAESLVTSKRSAGVVQDIWCNAARTVFKWAVETKKLSANPFQDVKIAVPRKVRSREKVFKTRGNTTNPEGIAVIQRD